MTPSRLLVPVLLALAVGVAGCGGGSSGGGASTGSGGSTGTASTASSQGSGSGGGDKSAAAFCAVFTSAGTIMESAVSSSDAASKLRDFADKIQSTAPDDIKDPAKALADAYRGVADGIGSLKAPPSLSADATKAITTIAVWSATHCGGLQPSAS